MYTVRRTVRRTMLIATFALAIVGLSGCSGVQIDSAPVERFAEGNYQTYSWRVAAIENTDDSKDFMYVVDPTIRSAVNKELQSKGYRMVDAKGDFVIDYQFKTSLSDGALSSTALMSDNRYPIPNTEAVINRRTDQALVDNAYALSGPRQVNSVLITFSDGADQGLVWAASMSKIVEDVNQQDPKDMAKSVNSAVSRTFGKLPKAQ